MKKQPTLQINLTALSTVQLLQMLDNCIMTRVLNERGHVVQLVNEAWQLERQIGDLLAQIVMAAGYGR